VHLDAGLRVAAERGHQWIEQGVAVFDPAAVGRGIEAHAFAGVDAGQAVQRDVVAVFGDEHVGQQGRPGDTARDRPARRCRLEDRLAAHARQLGAHMTDHLEACRHVLQLLGDVGADLAQPAAARGATTGVAGRIVRSIGRCRAVHLVLARQVRGQLPIKPCAVRSFCLRRRLGRRLFIQWCALDQSDLRVIQLLAGATVLSPARTQQLQRELVDHQLEERHLGVTLLDDAQQRFDGVGRRSRGGHGDLLCRPTAAPAIGGAPEASSSSGSGGEFGLVRSHRHAPVDAFEQHRQLRRCQRHAAARGGLRPDEATAFQALG